MDKITGKNIEEAYILLKKQMYCENNTMLHIKKRLVDYEKRLLTEESKEKEFNEIINAINMKQDNKLESWYNEIKFVQTIKKIENMSQECIVSRLENINIEKLTKSKIKEQLDKILNFREGQILTNYIIDCPIELHIIAVFWVINFGKKLDSRLNNYSYGNRLDLDENLEIKKGRLFKWYPKQYKNWKENGFRIAEKIIKNENEGVLLVSLDLKKFYYNISAKQLKEKIQKCFDICNCEIEKKLTEIIFKINENYGEKIAECDREVKKGNILPIGIYSSPILANFYLKDFDQQILSEVSPCYYGRYVDDLFIIMKIYKSSEELNYYENFKNKFNVISCEKNLKKIGFKYNKEQVFNMAKTKIEKIIGEDKEIKFFNMKEKFLNNSSAFAMMPDDEVVKKAYEKIIIKDDDIKKERFNISVYLSEVLEIYNDVDIEKNNEIINESLKKIMSFFSEDNILKHSNYFEKLFTLFLMLGEIPKLESMYERFYKNFEKNKERFKNNNYEYLKEEFLKNSLLFSLALTPNKIEDLSRKFLKEILMIDKDNLLKRILDIVNSNMFKHRYISYPLLNYLKFGKNKDKVNNIKNINFFKTSYLKIVEDKKEKNKFKIENLEIDKNKIKFSPRFINLDEINLYNLKKIILEHQQKETNIVEEETKDYFKESMDLFEESMGIDLKSGVFKDNIQLFKAEETKIDINFLKVKSSEKINNNKIKIGVASILIREEEISEDLLFESKSTFGKKEKLFSILNQAKKNKVDILIFSELAIPFKWLKVLNEFSRKNHIVITGGLNYIFSREFPYSIENKKYAYNFLFTILPFRTDRYKTAITNIRLKNYYSPGEIQLLEGRRFSVPKWEKMSKYYVFSWEGLYFSNFNCFELCDISSRSKMKNYIDLMIGCVFNKDLTYFDNIISSTCRDLSAYFAQSNTSIYGDCKVYQPTSKNNCLLGSVTGGINNNLLVIDLDIKGLREHQLLNVFGQKGNKFKYTPPGIDPNIVKSRIKNCLEEVIVKNN